MPHDFIDTKKLAEIGESLLEAAIISTLTKARKANEGFLRHEEISDRAGIKPRPGNYTPGGMALDLLIKLKEKKIVIEANSSGRARSFMLTDKHYEMRR